MSDAIIAPRHPTHTHTRDVPELPRHGQVIHAARRRAHHALADRARGQMCAGIGARAVAEERVQHRARQVPVLVGLGALRLLLAPQQRALLLWITRHKWQPQ